MRRWSFERGAWILFMQGMIMGGLWFWLALACDGVVRPIPFFVDSLCIKGWEIRSKHGHTLLSLEIIPMKMFFTVKICSEQASSFTCFPCIEQLYVL